MLVGVLGREMKRVGEVFVRRTVGCDSGSFGRGLFTLGVVSAVGVFKRIPESKEWARWR